MAWSEERARSSIQNFISGFNQSDVMVETYTDRRLRKLAEARAGSGPVNPLIDIPFNRAVLTDGVHIYARLIRFDELVANENSASEAAHAELLSFLHTHYSACDRLVEEFGIQRVDFHVGRMHAVVLQPEGASSEIDRIKIALAFADALTAMVSETFEPGMLFHSELAIGIDSGRAVAINSGRKPEQEPLFIGCPANRAAHLADPDLPGIRLSERVRKLAASQGVDTDLQGRVINADSSALLEQHSSLGSRLRVREAIEEHRRWALGASAPEPARFKFHKASPPLRSIDFAALMPSNSVRTDLVALFADICGYSAFIDRAIEGNDVRAAVHAIHVIRKELVRVIRDDFGGRKVRFIGDCVHALIAEGSSAQIDPRRTANNAVLLGGALRSSFAICREELGTIADLGLSIGAELGTTPITRLGFRGERSVRCAASKATSLSEKYQSITADNTIMVGPRLYEALGPGLKQLIMAPERPWDVYYQDAERFSDIENAMATGSAKPQIVRSHAN